MEYAVHEILTPETLASCIDSLILILVLAGVCSPEIQTFGWSTKLV